MYIDTTARAGAAIQLIEKAQDPQDLNRVTSGGRPAGHTALNMCCTGSESLALLLLSFKCCAYVPCISCFLCFHRLLCPQCFLCLLCLLCPSPKCLAEQTRRACTHVRNGFFLGIPCSSCVSFSINSLAHRPPPPPPHPPRRPPPHVHYQQPPRPKHAEDGEPQRRVRRLSAKTRNHCQLVRGSQREGPDV